MRPLLPAYMAAFAQGARGALQNRAEVTTSLVIYSVLMVIFNSIYKIMPLHELGVPGITRANMLWYFAITECVIVSSPGLAQFGRMIGDGKLTEMLQRPAHIMGLFMARALGAHLSLGLLIFCFASILLPLFFNAPMPAELVYVPLIAVSFVLSAVLFEAMGYMLCTVEVLGPYSRPTSWIIGKFIFTFGGLFFPVQFFPRWLEKAVMMTPFPSVIYTPASSMLLLPAQNIVKGIVIQAFWVFIVVAAALLAERRMLAYVLERGD